VGYTIQKNIMLLFHQDHHWSLIAICNAFSVTQDQSSADISVEVPFILFLDPMDCHPIVDMSARTIDIFF
jgi:hypothetical protein